MASNSTSRGSLALALVVVAALVASTTADMYLQNMRGSNNRLDEARRDRNNANRLFDSQNNNRGGYNVGSLNYYEGETIPLEWTNQHACGNDYNDCQIVIQYMCSDNLRDGVTTRTIPDQPSNCLNNDCNTDVRYGMHEDYDYYVNCKYRMRNRGLFTSDRNLRGNTAIYTRQNNNGARHGFECPEERDHYPYWHPTPWIDWVIFTNNASRCDAYRNQSENVLGRNYCAIPDTWYHHKVATGGNGRNGFIPNTKETCEALNEEGSEMVAFLREQRSPAHEQLLATVEAEFQRCIADIRSCFDNAWDNSTLQVCLDDWRVNRTITAAELEALCPDCPGSNVVHPESMSTCPLCVPSECVNTRVLSAYNATLNATCPENFVHDTVNASYCVQSWCPAAYNDSLAFQQEADRCRASHLNATGLHLVSDQDSSCMHREVIERECFLQNLPRARWARAPSHSEVYPHVRPPQCMEADWSRVNHLGNGVGGQTNGWNLTYPGFAHERCATRIRYNITTWDYAGLDPHNAGQVNSSLNKDQGNGPAHINVAGAHGIQTSDSARPWENARGYLFEQNPQVQIFDFFSQRLFCADPELTIEGDPTYCYTRLANGSVDYTGRQPASRFFCPVYYPEVAVDPADQTYKCFNGTGFLPGSSEDKDFDLQLAINTAQLGRTFQDRSHRYKSTLRDDELRKQCDGIFSLNVRGKRGNIVQTFPGTEYDFTPNRLHIREGDCVHFQWTGSNTNPNHNDGQGKQGTDRSNVALLEYVRGQFGRGVEKAGGQGADGTFWTTKDQEPGLEGWRPNMYPTMGDYPCPPEDQPTLTEPHPYNWRLCYEPSSKCEWIDRPTETAQAGGSDGQDASVLLDCPQDYEVEPANELKCVRSECPRADRPTNWEQRPARVRLEDIGVPDKYKHGAWGMSHPEHLDNVTRDGFLGMTYQQLVDLSTLNNVQLGGEMSELDDAGTYFDIKPHRVTGVGTYHYMCTRNNNFSNRSQKGKIVVTEAPQTTAPIGSRGGIVTMSTEDTFSGVRTDEVAIELSDFSVNIEPKSLPSLQHIGLSAIATGGRNRGLSTAGSDILQVTPLDLATIVQFLDTTLQLANTRREGVMIREDIRVTVRILDATQLYYRLTSDAFEPWARQYYSDTGNLPYVQVEFKTAQRQHAVVNTTFNNQFEIEGIWGSISPASLSAIEAGDMWVSLWFDGNTEYTALPERDPESGKPITVRMPVTVAISYGDVYYFPDTPAGRACVYNGTSCHQIRRKIPNARIRNGEAVFQVGGSAAAPAGGYYQVSGGSNLPLIVSVTISCIILALVIVGCAVYFRQHPDKWQRVRQWGPNKYRKFMLSIADNI
ncbi:hypothetical protein PTSG_02295 [Salpingoeca rosetta]|uniref:Uncharacterized protein n=1 Tax=Salpingoeca rosetta (strain ATCC 50818 / BSB-021) TaxID=946362 RepID=F2U1S8_SALR5|nr:uncharacterized protein PTSG_02295 [Salpingoeca rosetta]EGD81580.1 hypothetical protein PTSG_02295 [Salpingoeca rosetta]|eukprot:XP_004996784.1 hypothetical protein PTSG_02295 [Salpingoeca rosetta]